MLLSRTLNNRSLRSNKPAPESPALLLMSSLTLFNIERRVESSWNWLYPSPRLVPLLGYTLCFSLKSSASVANVIYRWSWGSRIPTIAIASYFRNYSSYSIIYSSGVIPSLALVVHLWGFEFCSSLGQLGLVQPTAWLLVSGRGLVEALFLPTYGSSFFSNWIPSSCWI